KDGPAVAGAGVQELRSDTVVQSDSARDLLNVGTDLLGEIGDLVDEGDLGGEESVGRVLDELGRTAVGEEYRRTVEVERPVQFAHDLTRASVRRTDDNAVRMLEILNGRAFAEEFWIRDDRAVGIGPCLADD